MTAANRLGERREIVEWPVDMTPILDRQDALVYVSAPMTADVTIAGPVSVILHAASSARDADFVALLEDVGPDGYGVKLGSKPAGVVRARHRHGLDREDLLTPEQPERFEIYCGFFGHTFRAGHRIRLGIASSLFPRFNVNAGTGNPIATDTDDPVRARQTVFHDRARASHIRLPVIDPG
jgi:hypothetical protein